MQRLNLFFPTDLTENADLRVAGTLKPHEEISSFKKNSQDLAQTIVVFCVHKSGISIDNQKCP